jgi:hypothetical protein
LPDFAKRSASVRGLGLYDIAMPRHVVTARHERRTPIARRVPRAAVIARPVARPTARAFAPRAAPAFDAGALRPGYGTDPYVDYGRFLTPEGGILFVYKDLDFRWRHAFWRVFAWCAATGPEGWYLLLHSPVHRASINVGLWFAMMLVNFIIVAKPPEVYRKAEIRPDCMILEGAEVFWLALMEAGWPEFRKDEEGNQVLSGIYGSRFVDYLTLRRFDEYDRVPEVFAAHLKEAMQQLWTNNSMIRTRALGRGPEMR